MSKLTKIAMLIMFIAGIAKAQQLVMFNHYFYKPFILNPAFAGNENKTEAFTINRTQWTGFSNAPQFNIISIDGALKSKKVGLGMSVYNDRKGISNRTGGDLSYSYKLNFNDKTQLSFGLSAGVVSQVMNFSKAVSESTNDPYLFSNTEQKTSFNLNAGILFNWGDLSVAAAAPQLAQNKFNYLDNAGQNKVSYVQYRHYLSSLTYKVHLNKTKGLSLTPTALIRIVPGAPIQYDGNLNLEFENKFWIGATYKSNYAISAQAGVCLYRQLNIGYSYEIITHKLSKQAALSHEIMLSFVFGKSKKQSEEDPTKSDIVNTKNQDHTIDSLHHELENKDITVSEKDKKIEELNKQIAELKKQKENALVMNAIPNTNSNQNSNTNKITSETNSANNNNNNTTKAINNSHSDSNNINNSITNNTSTNKINGNRSFENSTLIITTNGSEIKTTNNKNAQKGYYIIAGTFYYEDFAQNEANRFKSKGYTSAACVKSTTNEYTYVFLKQVKTKAEALKLSETLKFNGVKDAWILAVE